MKRLFAHTQQYSLVKQFRIRLRFVVSLLICALFLLSVVSVLIFVSQYTLGEQKVAIHDDLNGILSSMIDQESDLRGYISTNNPVFLEPFTSGRPAYLLDVQRLKNVVSSHNFRATSAALTQVEACASAWYTTYALVQIQNMQSGNIATARSLRLMLSASASWAISWA